MKKANKIRILIITLAIIPTIFVIMNFKSKPVSRLPVNKTSVRIFECPTNKVWICNRIVEIADREQFNNPQLLIEIVRRESRFQNVSGVENSQDKGFYQINMRYWSDEISEEEAFNLDKATVWTIGKLKEGKLSLWNTF